MVIKRLKRGIPNGGIGAYEQTGNKVAQMHFAARSAQITFHD